MRKIAMWCGVLAAALIACSACGSEASSDASGSADKALAAEAQTTVDAAMTMPTDILVTEPLKAKPESGKTVVYLQCEVPQCLLQGEGMKAATEALGWKMRVLNFEASNPATLVAAMETALQYDPVAVFFAAVPYDSWKSMEAKYKAAGAYIIPTSVPDVKLSETVLTSMASEPTYAASGKLLADQVTALSKGSAKIMFTTVPSFVIYKPLQAAYEAELKKVCPGCASQTFEATIQQVTANQMVPAVVSELKRNPDIKYVVSANGTFIAGLPDALKAAGIDPKSIKIISNSGSAAVQKLVKDGLFYSTTAFGFGYEGWLGIDAVLRAQQGQAVGEEHQLLPLPILTADNVGEPKDSYDVPADYEAQFKELWHLN